MDELKEQAPTYISHENILEIYLKNNSNVSTSLLELWDIKEVNNNITEVQCKWNEIREICNEYDNEMYKQLRKKSNNIPVSISNLSCENNNITDNISYNTTISHNNSECSCNDDNDIVPPVHDIY
tara:strand:+ start:112 stop:486 length:375 start_codon:yes stop_codon:yes gene_type:complete